jgi:DNA-binding NtrC family response regulator
MKWYSLLLPGVLFIGALMFNTITSLWRKRPLESFDQSLTRERLIQSARIVVVEDEVPLLIAELKTAGFAVDHDREGSDLRNFDNQIYDLAIVDYHGVGQRLGESQGLALLKHIRRVSPRTRVLAYTSRSLDAKESEFFRLSHDVLRKDWGLEESLALVESELQKAFSKEHLLDALLSKLNIYDQKEKERIRAALVSALTKGDEQQFKTRIEKIAGKVGEKAVDLIISHIFGSK